MSKKKLHAVFILDETGSMQVRKAAAISGYNEYVETLKSNGVAKGLRFSLVSFNSGHTTTVCDAVRVKDIPLLTNDSYRPDNCTPLYDAIGTTLRAMEKSVVDGGALVIILTDGEENDSKSWTRVQVYDLIKEKKDAGWKFVFLGADVDAYQAGYVNLGIDSEDCATYASGCTGDVVGKTVAQVTMTYAASGGMGTGGARATMNATVPGALVDSDSRATPTP